MMSSEDTGSAPSTGPSTGPSTSDQSKGSVESQASTFDTQPPSSQDVLDNSVQPWGQLSVIGTNICHELVKDQYIIGRAKDCDVVLKDKAKPTTSSLLWKACSKQHFRIYIETKSSGRFIFIEDLSANGTIVNENVIGKGKFNVLVSGDVISLVNKAHRSFMFLDFNGKAHEDGNVPKEVMAKYMVLSDLGSGACGLVKLAVRKSDCLRVACKCIDKSKFTFSSSTCEKQLMKEVSIIKALNHPCVIKVVDVIDTADMFCIFMELAEAGDLFKEIKLSGRLDPDQARAIFYQTCLAVKHLHDNNVVHRDLKPENILLSNCLPNERVVKVTDFGYSCVMDTSSLLKTLCGTPLYIAPEIVATHGMGGGYTKAVDCWSLGVILYVCITGQPAFTAQRTDMPMRDQILTGSYKLKDKYWEYIPQAKDLVSKLLVVDPKQRLTLDQVLNHPWFQEDKDMLSNTHKLLNITDPTVSTTTPLPSTPEQERKRRRIGAGDEFRQDSATPLLRIHQSDPPAMSVDDSLTPTFSDPKMDTNSSKLSETTNMSTSTT